MKDDKVIPLNRQRGHRAAEVQVERGRRGRRTEAIEPEALDEVEMATLSWFLNPFELVKILDQIDVGDVSLYSEGTATCIDVNVPTLTKLVEAFANDGITDFAVEVADNPSDDLLGVLSGFDYEDLVDGAGWYTPQPADDGKRDLHVLMEIESEVQDAKDAKGKVFKERKVRAAIWKYNIRDRDSIEVLKERLPKYDMVWFLQSELEDANGKQSKLVKALGLRKITMKSTGLPCYRYKFKETQEREHRAAA